MKYKNKLSLSIILILFVSSNHLFSIILEGSLIKTSRGLIPIEDLQSIDSIITCFKKLPSQDQITTSIVNIDKLDAPISEIVEINTSTGTIQCALKQLLYDPAIQKWIYAENATSTTILLNSDLKWVHCLEVTRKSLTTKAYNISLKSPHVLFFSSSEILTHNFIPLVVGISFSFGIGEGIALSGISLGIGALCVGVAGIFSGNKRGYINISGVKDKISRLPRGGSYPFKPQKSQDGEIKRDRNGGFIDERGRSWIWDPKKEEWDVQIDGGKRHINVKRSRRNYTLIKG